jgi:hypothetical protein
VYYPDPLKGLACDFPEVRSMETPAERLTRYTRVKVMAVSDGGYSGAAMQVLTKGETRLEATKFHRYTVSAW